MRFQKIKLIFLICIVVVLTIFTNAKIICADGNTFDDYQYIYGEDGNIIFSVSVFEEGTIVFQGKHAKSGTSITYHTVGFNMSLKQHDILNSTTLNNSYYISRSSEDTEYTKSLSKPDKDYTIDFYQLDCENVIDGLLSLLRQQGNTTQQAYKKLAQGVTVYFSNVFEVVDRKTMQRIGTAEYATYRAIIESVEILKNVSWSSETQEILKYYYNNPIQIKLTPFAYDVVYVDADDYLSKGVKATPIFYGEADQLVAYGQNAQATLPSNLIKNGVKYQYSGADYVYDSGQHNTMYLPSLSQGVISAYHGNKSNATLYVLLKKANENVTPTVTPSPTPTPTITVKPTVTANSISHFSVDSVGVIQTDTSKTTGYNAMTGIPTTEYLYGSIQTAEYLLNIQYQIKTGQISYPVTVSKTYLLEKPSEESEPSSTTSSSSKSTTSSNSNKTTINKNTNKTNSNTETQATIETEAVTVTQSGSVTRSYQYTEIVSIDYYKISQGTLTNDTLPGTTITLKPNGYTVPNLSYEHYDGDASHIVAPYNAGGTISLASETVTEIPKEDLVSQGASQVGAIQVRNDKLTFDGKTIMNSSWASQSAGNINSQAVRQPSRTGSKVLYQGNQQIAMTLANGSYPSSGTITYEKVIGYQSSLPSTITYPISVNTVQLHTPVYCEPIITQDNETYLQLMKPDLTCIPLIIDENSLTSDFILHISNQGYHSGKTGYGNQDYVNYVATKEGKRRNEVKFPVEVYQDTGNDNNSSNDILISKEEWTVLADPNQRFYLPMWVEEGKYTIDVRSIANNGEGAVDKTQQLSNNNMQNYVATNTFQVEVSGRLYGLTMYDVKDYPLWEKTFLSSNPLVLKRNLSSNLWKFPSGVSKDKFDSDAVYDYRVGTMDSYGLATSRLSRYTLPLIKGSHPQYSNQGLLKSGYMASFLLHTNGSMMSEENARIEITPRFYYMDARGNNREEVDLYYKGSVNGKKYSIIKVGSAIDQSNSKIYTVGSTNLSIPTKELEMTAQVQGITTNQLKAKKQELFTYSLISLGSTFRMDSNLTYANKYQSADHGKEQLATLKQSYYFQYSLPNGVRATKKGTDVVTYAAQKGITYKEDFWKKDGYIVVNFDIKAYDSAGNLRYSYTNKDNYLANGLCCMWLLEGYQMTKTDYTGREFNFLLGDVLIYDTDTTASDDYSSSGIY